MNSENKLRKIQDEKVISTLITSVKENGLEVFVWRLVGNTKHLAVAKIDCVRKSRDDFSIVPVAGSEIQVQDLLSGHNYIDLYIPDSGLLLRCLINQTNAPVRYYLKFPEYVAQIERRKSIRLNVYESEELRIGFIKTASMPRPVSQNFQKTCFDVSSGGFSFLVSRLESKLFKIHDPIRNINIIGPGFSTKVNVEIALIKEIDPDQFNGPSYKVWRVCCRFTQIDQLSIKYLERFIFERIKNELHAING